MRTVLSKVDGLAIWICVAMLAGGLILQVGASEEGMDLAAGRARIRNALLTLPDALGAAGEWVKVSDEPVPPTEASMLGLNSYVNRIYQRLGEVPRRRVELFIANSTDARSMMGHHPPNCYPSSGYRLEDDLERGAVFETSIGSTIPVRVYRFRRSSEGSGSLIVVNGFLMPDGRAVATLEETRGLTSRAATSRLGLTQFQIVFDGDLPVSDVDRYTGELLGGLPEEVYWAVGGVVDGLADAYEGGGT